MVGGQSPPGAHAKIQVRPKGKWRFKLSVFGINGELMDHVSCLFPAAMRGSTESWLFQLEADSPRDDYMNLALLCRLRNFLLKQQSKWFHDKINLPIDSLHKIGLLYKNVY